VKPTATGADPGPPAEQDDQAFSYLYDLSGFEKDAVQAVHWYTKAPEKGRLPAALLLGRLYCSF
jgi:TPR repeat protein